MACQKLTVLIIGPSAEYISGSLLRPLNIWYALNGKFRHIHVEYMPTRDVARLLLYLKKVLKFDLAIISGVNPWIAASVVVIRKLFRKPTIVDVHGFAWYETSVTKGTNLIYRIILLVSEKITYRNATFIVVASRWLSNVLQEYFHVKNVFIIENAVCFLFERIVNRLKQFDYKLLRKLVCLKILRLESCEKILIVAPLPRVFISNILAYEILLELIRRLPKDIVIAVTGAEECDNVTKSAKNLIHIGYLAYPLYTALILSSDAVILPYPSSAICGGVRNKILEAGYCKKLVISTKTGVVHLPVLPFTHYLPIEELEHRLEKILTDRSRAKYLENIAYKLHEIIMTRHSFTKFKKRLLNTLKNMLTLIIESCR